MRLAHRLSPRSITIIMGLCFAVSLGLSRDTRPIEAGPVQFVIVVNTTADESGLGLACSLREAIVASSINMPFGGCSTGGASAPDTIAFSLGTGTPVINIDTSLPLIAGPVIIDGNTFGADRVELRGQGSGVLDGLVLDTGAAGSQIKRLVINGFPGSGIVIGAANVTLRGNFIGTDASGTNAATGSIKGVRVTGDGVRIGGTAGTTPGGSCTGDCNLISGQFDGIAIQSGANAVIEGNFIGTDVTGTEEIGNTVGIRIEAQGALVGGPDAGQGNLISGNGFGVISTKAVTVQGNLIGTDTTGMNRLGNVAQGVQVFGANSVIGGVEPGAGNVISGNGVGVNFFEAEQVEVLGNLIGTAVDGVTPLGNLSSGVVIAAASSNNIIGGDAGNTIAFNGVHGVLVNGAANGPSNGNQIRRNSIYGNFEEGIENINGGNTELAPPVILATGSASGTACPNCTVDVYSDDEDEGRIYEGSTTADGKGDWTFSGSVTGPFVTATATDSGNNTSEFSAPRTIPFPTPTPSPSPSPSPTPTGAPVRKQGDLDCNAHVNARDALMPMLLAAGVPMNTPGGCIPLGAGNPPFGSVNCDGLVDKMDTVFILQFAAKVGIAPPQPVGCTPIGQNLPS